MAREERGVSLDHLSDYYDVLTPGERSGFRRKQIDLAGLCAGDKVLEVGCGTGALSLLSKRPQSRRFSLRRWLRPLRALR